MKCTILILFYCSFILAQKTAPATRITDSITEIKVFNLKESKGIVFPSEYAKKLFIEDSTDTVIGFFTPDEKTIRFIDEELPKKYYSTIQKFNNQWKKVLDDKEYFKEQKLALKKEANNVNKYCKQFFGYINDRKEKIIVIQLLDFSEDPSDVKKQVTKEYIIGFHGWFETNVSHMRFHVESKKFTVNEDI